MQKGAVIISLALAAVAAGASSTKAAAQNVIVGPNVQVSRDGDFPHEEALIVAHPTDPNVLVSASVTMAGTPLYATKATARTYASADGGNTWRASSFPESRYPDPQIAFGPDGTVYFTAIYLPLYRSTKGGMPGTWENAGYPSQGDHPFIVVDHTNGKRRGRIYISGHGNSLQVIDPGERMTFYHPVRSNPVGYPNTMTFNPLVLRDGTLFVPFNESTKQEDGTYDTKMRFVLSTDGGQTFGHAADIRSIPTISYEVPHSVEGSFIRGSSGPHYALDSHVHRDRIYAVWCETSAAFSEWMKDPSAHKPPRTLLIYSDDRGATWSNPIEVGAPAPAHSAQWLPMIAVNNEGTVAVAWLDTRDDPRQLSYHVYFTASTDGAQTFTPARRISTQTSFPYNDENLALGYRLQRVNEKSGARNIQFESAYRRWADGGDYLGMTATTDGVFHPLWADARNGSHQLYTTRITVSDNKAGTPPANLVETDVTDRIELLVDPESFEAGVASFPIRLRNISGGPVYGPLRVELQGADLFTLIDIDGVAGTTRADYTGALGDLPALPPNAVSDVVVWRLRYDSFREVPGFDVKIFGRLPKVDQ